MAISFFGETWVPAADNSTTPLGSSTPHTITPPASMVAGQVVLVFVTARNNTDPAVVTTGGQTWTSHASNVNGTTIVGRLFSCIFNGTWSANPTFSTGSTTDGVCLYMGVFSGVDNVNVFDVSPTAIDFASASSKTLTGFNTSVNGSWAFFMWGEPDDNALSGQDAGWTGPDGGTGALSDHVGNQGGLDIGLFISKKTQTTAGATGNNVVALSTADVGAGYYFALRDASPTVVLNTPTEAQSVSDTTPTFDFTGTDLGSDDIRYNLEVLKSTITNYWYDEAWPFRVKITVDNARIASDLTDFPVYVDLSSLPSGFHTNVNQTDGRDIRVTTSDGATEVPREVVFYDSATDTGELHFKAPSLLSASDTDFYIYYGNSGASEPAAGATYGKNNTWKSGYKAVWHLQEDPFTTSPTDSTSNANTLTATGFAAGQSISAKVGKGIDTLAADYLSINDNATLDIAGSYTIGGWINIDAGPATVPVIIKVGDSGSFHNYYLDIDSNRRAVIGHFNGTTWVETAHSSNTQIPTGAWHFLIGRYDHGAGVLTVRLDDTENATASSITGTPAVSTQPLRIMTQTGSPVIDGRADELRVYSGALSDAELNAWYYNENDPSTFYAVGSQEELVIGVVSGTDSGFANPDNGADTDPFTSGENIQFTVQSGDALPAGIYYWRVRGKDPNSSNAYGAWTSTRSIIIIADTSGFFRFFGP